MANDTEPAQQILSVVPTVQIGITGHRVLPEGERERITRQVRAVMAEVQCATREILAEQKAKLPQGCVSGEPFFRLLTPLAEGADRLAARTALELGYTIQCPLPFSRTFYENTFSSDDAEHTEFRELLGKAESVLELVGSDESFTSQAYADVGSIVVNHADFLIAVWDGKPSRYIAGTYASVHQALRRHIPVIVIDATAGNAPIAYREENTTRHDWQAALRGHLRRFLFPRGSAEAEISLFPLRRLKIHRFHVWLRGLEKLLLGKENAPKPLPPTDAPAGIPEPTASVLWMERKQLFSEAVADMSAAYRNLLVGRLLFPLLATVFLTLALNAANLPLFGAVIRHTGWNPHHVRMVFFGLQVICLVISLVQVGWDRLARYHRGFLCYRVMAELCRQTTYLYPVGFANAHFHPHTYPIPDGSDITAWYYRMLLRRQGLPQGSLTHGDLKNWLLWVRAKLLVPQHRYHGNRARRCNIMQSKLGRIAFCFFVLGLFATVLRALLDSMVGSAATPEPGAWLALFASLALIFPPTAVFFSAISQYAGYPAHAATSRNMRDFFQALIADVDSLLQKPAEQIYYSDILHICEELDLHCREELSDWESTLREKPLKWV